MDIVDLLQDVQQVVRRCPLPTLTQAYLRSARQFCTQTRWLRRSVLAETVESELELPLLLESADADLEIIAVRRIIISTLQTGREQSWTITPSDSTTWRPQDPPGRPRTYDYVPEAAVAFHPLPDAAYGVDALVQVTPKRMATTLPEDLLTKWEYALADGATEYLLNIPGQAWSNPALAKAKYGTEFRAAINNARADEQRAYNTGTVFSRIPPKFGYYRR